MNDVVRSNGIFLLIIIILFSLSVKLLPSKNKKRNTVNDNKLYSSAFFINESPIDQAIIYIRPLIASESIGTLAQSLDGVQLDKVLEIVDYFIENKSLNNDKILLLLLALTFNYEDDTFAQYQILNRIVDNSLQKNGTPVLLVAARSEEYTDVIPTLITWAKKQGVLGDFTTQALITAIRENDLNALKLLADYGLPISKDQASQALLYAVKNNKDSSMVPFLVEHGADVDFVDKGKTLLVYATQNNNAPMVAVLLKAGAKPQKFGKPSIGTPLQIAIEKGYADIDVLLREYGAKEN